MLHKQHLSVSFFHPAYCIIFKMLLWIWCEQVHMFFVTAEGHVVLGRAADKYVLPVWEMVSPAVSQNLNWQAGKWLGCNLWASSQFHSPWCKHRNQPTGVTHAATQFKTLAWVQHWMPLGRAVWKCAVMPFFEQLLNHASLYDSSPFPMHLNVFIHDRHNHLAEKTLCRN